MIRFILKRRMDNSYDCVTAKFETVDVDVPELEALLRRGGQGVGGPGYDITELFGVEVLAAQPSGDDGGRMARKEDGGIAS